MLYFLKENTYHLINKYKLYFVIDDTSLCKPYVIRFEIFLASSFYKLVKEKV